MRKLNTGAKLRTSIVIEGTAGRATGRSLCMYKSVAVISKVNREEKNGIIRRKMSSMSVD